MNGRLRTRLLVLFAAVGAVLLLACTNVASLLLARSAARGREIAVRVSMGATSGRVVRQLLTESVMLALMGAALGLALAALLIDLAPGFVPINAIPTTAPIQLNLRVLLFTRRDRGSDRRAVRAGAGALAGALRMCGKRSMTRAADPPADAAASDSGRAMVVIEVAVALVLLAGAGLMTESLRRMTAIELGFDVNHLLTLRLFLPVTRYNAAQSVQFQARAKEKIAALPGVESVAHGHQPSLDAAGHVRSFRSGHRSSAWPGGAARCRLCDHQPRLPAHARDHAPKRARFHGT